MLDRLHRDGQIIMNSRNPTKQWLKPFLSNLKRLEVLGICVAALALTADVAWKIVIESPALKRERAAQEIERENASVAREMQAWSHLSLNSAGIDGYDTAIEYLLQRRGVLAGIDLSCESRGGTLRSIGCDAQYSYRNWNLQGNSDRKDEKELFLSDMNAVGATFNDTAIRNLKISNSNFEGAHFDGSDIIDSKFYGTNLSNSRITNTTLEGSTFSRYRALGLDLSDATFLGVDMTNFNCLGCDLENALFMGVNISNANFSGSINMTKDQLNRSTWAWSDMKPKLPTGLDLDDVILCDANLRNVPGGSYKPVGLKVISTNTVRPDGCDDWHWADWPTKNAAQTFLSKSCDPSFRELYYQVNDLEKEKLIRENCG